MKFVKRHSLKFTVWKNIQIWFHAKSKDIKSAVKSMWWSTRLTIPIPITITIHDVLSNPNPNHNPNSQMLILSNSSGNVENVGNVRRDRQSPSVIRYRNHNLELIWMMTGISGIVWMSGMLEILRILGISGQTSSVIPSLDFWPSLDFIHNLSLFVGMSYD